MRPNSDQVIDQGGFVGMVMQIVHTPRSRESDGKKLDLKMIDRLVCAFDNSGNVSTLKNASKSSTRQHLSMQHTSNLRYNIPGGKVYRYIVIQFFTRLAYCNM